MDESLTNIAAEFEEDFNVEPSTDAGTSGINVSEEVPPKVPKISPKTNLLVNPKQRGNPLLKHLHNIVWEFEDIVPDYQMGQTSCALFLSMQYHNLRPEYIHSRLKMLGKLYQLRVLLVLIDMLNPHHVLKTLTRMCILADLTLILARSSEEAGKIIETYKIYENKPSDSIRERNESSMYLRLIQALTAIKPVNKSDAVALLNRFKSLEGILKASEFQLADVPGIGPRKAKKLYNTLHSNFRK